MNSIRVVSNCICVRVKIFLLFLHASSDSSRGHLNDLFIEFLRFALPCARDIS